MGSVCILPVPWELEWGWMQERWSSFFGGEKFAIAFHSVCGKATSRSSPSHPQGEKAKRKENWSPVRKVVWANLKGWTERTWQLSICNCCGEIVLPSLGQKVPEGQLPPLKGTNLWRCKFVWEDREGTLWECPWNLLKSSCLESAFVDHS